MLTRNYKPEQVVTILRQIEVQMANGKTAPQACQKFRESHCNTSDSTATCPVVTTTLAEISVLALSSDRSW